MSVDGVRERTIDVEGLRTRYLTAGDDGGPPLVLLHGVGTSAGEWSWVLPGLARNHRVYAVDLPGYDGSYEPPDYAPAFTATFIGSFLEAVGVESAVVVGNSFGGLSALHLALSEPARVSALVLSDSAGLDRAVNPALATISFPRTGQLATVLAKTRPRCRPEGTRPGVAHVRPPLADPAEVAQGSIQVGAAAELHRGDAGYPAQHRRPGGATRGVAREIASLADADAHRVGDRGQGAPLLASAGRAYPPEKGSLELIPNCGHLPHVEQPERFVSALDRFLRAEA
jgi:pimeloyl-ACP methyl ester carboxylesterase